MNKNLHSNENPLPDKNIRPITYRKKIILILITIGITAFIYLVYKYASPIIDPNYQFATGLVDTNDTTYAKTSEYSGPIVVFDDFSTEEMLRNRWFFTNEFPKDLGNEVTNKNLSLYVVFKGNPGLFFKVWQGTLGYKLDIVNHFMKPKPVTLKISQTTKDQIITFFKNNSTEYIIITPDSAPNTWKIKNN